jgi:hypothetical protein
LPYTSGEKSKWRSDEWDSKRDAGTGELRGLWVETRFPNVYCVVEVGKSELSTLSVKA